MAEASPHRRDPLAVLSVVFAFALQIGMWVWWGGRLDQRVAAIDLRVEKVEGKSAKDSEQDIAIAVMTSQFASIRVDLTEIKTGINQKNGRDR